MMGKHSQEALKIKQLEETIELKEKEIKDIKFSVSDVLLQIRNINESNNYSDPSVKKRKISELCTDTRYELLIDELEVCYKKQKTKIIELPIPTKVINSSIKHLYKCSIFILTYESLKNKSRKEKKYAYM